MAAKSYIINANLHYVDQYRKQLQKDYPTFDDFKQRFEIPQHVVDGILSEGEQHNIKPKDDAELAQTLSYMRLQLKALVARDLWDMDEYFAIFNESSDMVKRALELIESDN